MQRRSVTGTLSQGEEGSEYKQLWCAVMVRALDDFATVIRAYKDMKHPAVTTSEPYRWLLVSQDLSPGSFHWICGHLGWEPEIARNLVLNNWRELTRRMKITTVTK
jgi:hypothetical protein